jgi:hypothetical protein
VINRFAGPVWVVTVSGDPAGLHVEEVTVKGLPELFKTPHGGVLTRDAGYIVLRNTFDGDEYIGGEIVVNKGPHPQAESETLSCSVRSCWRRSGSELPTDLANPDFDALARPGHRRGGGVVPRSTAADECYSAGRATMPSLVLSMMASTSDRSRCGTSNLSSV